MEMTKAELKELYEENTNEEVCKILNISKVTLVKYLKDADIPLKGKGGGFASNKLKITN